MSERLNDKMDRTIGAINTATNYLTQEIQDAMRNSLIYALQLGALDEMKLHIYDVNDGGTDGIAYNEVLLRPSRSRIDLSFSSKKPTTKHIAEASLSYSIDAYTRGPILTVKSTTLVFDSLDDLASAIQRTPVYARSIDFGYFVPEEIVRNLVVGPSKKEENAVHLIGTISELYEILEKEHTASQR